MEGNKKIVISGISFKKQHMKNKSVFNYLYLEKEVKESELTGIHKYPGQLKRLLIYYGVSLQSYRYNFYSPI